MGNMHICIYIRIYVDISLHIYNLLEEGMATHSSILVWRIPWTEESGGLQAIGSY